MFNVNSNINNDNNKHNDSNNNNNNSNNDNDMNNYNNYNNNMPFLRAGGREPDREQRGRLHVLHAALPGQRLSPL